MGQEVLCRDLASGAVVPGVAFDVRHRAGPPLIADEQGRLAVPDGTDVRALQALAPWTVQRTTEASTAPKRDEIWLCRAIAVHVTLACDGTSDGRPPDFDRARVLAHVVPVAVDGVQPQASARHDLADGVYVEGRFLRMRHAEASVDPSGHSTLSAPRLPLLRVGAQVPGWHATPVEVCAPSDPEVGEVSVRLELRRRPRVRGVLRGSDGAPIQTQSLRLTTSATFESWERDVGPRLRELRGEGNSGLIAHSRKDGSAMVQWFVGGRSDAQGGFAMDVPRSGEGRLTALVPGYRPLVLDLGVLDADQDLELSLEAVPPGTPRVLLTHGGLPIRAQRMALTDLTDVDRQGPSEHLDVAADGTMPSDWLVPGRYYQLHVQSPLATRGMYQVRYDGGREIELSAIDMDPETALHRR